MIQESGNSNLRQRPVILTFVHYYLPGYKAGGPVRTIANLVESFGDELDFRIVTSDRDSGDTQPYPGLGGGDGDWRKVGKARVLYLAPNARKLRCIAEILQKTPHDALYLNSFFDPDFTLKPLLARRLAMAPKAPCILAPRGELSGGALQLKSRKKQLFMALARSGGLYRNLRWHASSEHEAADIRARLGARVPIRIAANLPAMAQEAPPSHPRQPGEPLRICFLSRISPMKNLDFALSILGELDIPVRFDIFGPVSDAEYWSRCQALMASLPANIEARHGGSIEHAAVRARLAEYDLFFLPTRGENFGHAIHEALSAGTPVLISDRTPWRQLQERGAGWDVPLADPARFRDILRHVNDLSPQAQAEARARAHGLAVAQDVHSAARAANRELFQTCLEPKLRHVP